ncbi:MAG: hypothetical protein LWX83_02115 [Anaerolineae bacterium]|nr:hypothetical protein [Anaerolineae bacterium]
MQKIFQSALLAVLDETFEHFHDFYLDEGTSLFETLETISAAQASLPVSKDCASIAAHTDHIRYFLDVLEQELLGLPIEPDWMDIWQNRRQVTQSEWQSIKYNLRSSYERILKLLKKPGLFDNEKNVGRALSILAHSAYHLGEIRQSLCRFR